MKALHPTNTCRGMNAWRVQHIAAARIVSMRKRRDFTGNHAADINPACGYGRQVIAGCAFNHAALKSVCKRRLL